MARPPIFVGGCGRSGTTLLRVILDSHSNIACGPELKITPVIAKLWHDCQTALYPTLQNYELDRIAINKSFSGLFESLVANYLAKTGKERVAEKTPNNVMVFPQLHGLFPHSPLVHMIRDGRDVVCSLLQMDWVDAATGERDPRTLSAANAARYWTQVVAFARRAQGTLGRAYYEIRYEDLVTRPEPILRDLFHFLEEPWQDAVLRFYEAPHDLAEESSADQVSRPISSNKVARWRRDLSPADLDTVMEIAGEELASLGYVEKQPV